MNISQELLLYWDYLTITSPALTGNYLMRIQFEIKESLANILDQLRILIFGLRRLKKMSQERKLLKLKT